VILVPLLFLILVSVVVGALGAYVISRDPFRALATEGTPGFAAAVASKTAARRDTFRRWIAACRHPTTATSLAFCAAFAVFVLGWLCLGLLAYFVRRNDAVVRIDSSVARWGHLQATGLSDSTMTIVTMLGDTLVIAGLAVLLAVADWLRHRNGRVVFFLVAVVVGNGLITVAVKLLTDRARPTFNPLTSMLGPAFPSGHSSMAAAFYAAAALLLSRGRSRRMTAALGGIAVTIAVAVASSRVFLDVHWVSDVIAGLALGWAWFAFCAIAFGGSPRRVRRREKTPAVSSLART
jgi:membrane-associated phospholipid phosphatase